MNLTSGFALVLAFILTRRLAGELAGPELTCGLAFPLGCILALVLTFFLTRRLTGDLTRPELTYCLAFPLTCGEFTLFLAFRLARCLTSDLT